MQHPMPILRILGLVFLLINPVALTVFASTDDATLESAVFGSGDRKQGYDTDQYVTNSLSITARKGAKADLLKYINEPILGLPAVSQPVDNIATVEKVELGRLLFFDRRLSLNDTFSCAICHIPEQGFTSNEIKTAVGIEGRSVKRNSPTIYNIAHYDILFQDGREDSLEQQAWSPLLAHNEMANPSIGYVINKIKAIKEYQGLFEQAFAGKGPTMETVGKALAVYQRTLNSANSSFDQWKYGDDENALSQDEIAGYQLFAGKAACASCHLIGADYALFTDNQLHNTGHGYATSMGIKPPKTRVQLAPGVFVDVDNEIINSVRQQPKQNDVGRYEVTQNPYDRWKYRTPSLRNIALTAPYMHDGAFSTLREVVDFYNRGGVENELLSPLIRPLNLTEQEIEQLIAFMQTLTGSNVKTLVADAFAAPIGDISKEDPNWAHDTQYSD